ncbi:related to Vault poly[ADP-ribose] polymerase [Phialocephala subalpina]|uniref:Related to Vault poly[ADP-ribose] polymerase n=1 Tax=Phialocephala subalpina TaxID=576137 RepID=A0A1L7XN84_9HELO|nr:related to Vault poly[ADP-ribose] polymerase [Phialocephala subalpina]
MSYLCGCYYHVASTDYYARYQKHYLPLLNSEVHSKILSTTSRTVLKQTFTNPSTTDAIKECIYTFPLYDGVSVVSFTCRIGSKVLTGLVKEKAKAKEIFDQAVSRGETAGLLEQAPEASDVFSTKLGNIPAGESIIVEITYVGELKHHENEGIRFTIPTKIAPRYGSGPSHGFSGGGPFTAGGDNGEIKIVVDVNMPEGSFIKGVQSPSHPIAVSMGTVSTATNDDPTMSKASATLSLGSAALEKDFVLIVQSKDVGTPKAILETHPTIPNHRALMATLVPKFSLPPSRSEIVFVADRSGSMQGNIEMLVSAMKVFLKSLPQGIKFNICSFGSNHTFLWDKSQTFSRETLEQASTHLRTFGANYGGTETFGAIKGTIERRLGDLPLEVILLTDGDIHRQNELFTYVNQQVEQTKGNIRVFTLGIGNGVSHALIEGLARAGNGFAQAVQQGERLDNAVVRMLRGALSPHITDYTLEVKYEQETDDDFELIDRVTESLKVLLTDDSKSLKSPVTSPKPTISLFDIAADPEKDALKGLQASTFSLPIIPLPKLLQAPHKIPTLFAFSRTTVYLLMSPETIQRTPIAVTLRGTSEHGPLAIEIPIETLAAPAETIHQLAAKKAVQDLEEGRGWIYDAKDQHGVLVKDKYPSSFDDLVQQEAVRLGEKFQIAGKWCSFVAVAANDKDIAEKKKKAGESSLDTDDDEFDEEIETSYQEAVINSRDLERKVYRDSSSGSPDVRKKSARGVRGGISFGRLQPVEALSNTSSLFGDSSASASAAPTPFGSSTGSSLFGSPTPATSGSLFGAAQQQQQQQRPAGTSGGLFSAPTPSHAGFGMAQSSVAGGLSAGGLFGSSQATPPPPYFQQQVQVTGFQPQAQLQAQYTGFPPSRDAAAPMPNNTLHFNGRSPVPPPPRSASLFGSTNNNAYAPPSPGFSTASPAFSPSSTSFSPTSPPMPSPAGSNNPFRRAALSAGVINATASARFRSGKKHKGSVGLGSVFQSAPSIPAPAPGLARRLLPSKAARRSAPSGFGGVGSGVDVDVDVDEMDMEISSPLPVLATDWSTKSIVEKVLALIDLQDFDGFWPADNTDIPKVIDTDVPAQATDQENKLLITMLVVKFLEMKCGDEEGTWELVVEKAKAWIQSSGLQQTEVESLEKTAEGIIKKN